MKKICTLGGGTGSFTVLRALKQIPNLDITSIVAMSDNGGSTGVLRDEYGVLPPGDVRQCLVALSQEETVMRELFSFRYESGPFQGHSFGNLFLSALEQITGDFEQAVKEASKILTIDGSVLPVTTTNTQLKLTFSDGKTIVGEDEIQSTKLPQKDSFELSLTQTPHISPASREKLLDADIILIGPGNLYCSLLPVLLPLGITDVFAQTQAEVMYISNLMQKPLHTDGYDLGDYIEVIEKAIKRPLDYVLANSTEISETILDRYESLESATPIPHTLSSHQSSAQIIEADIMSNTIESLKKGDLLQRTLIRHSPDKLATFFSKFLKTEA